MNLNAYEQTLLVGWEDVHKKSQLTLWLLLALKAAPKHMAEIKQFIYKHTNDTISADDKSMYRALRRLAEAEIVSYELETNKSGPDKKIYRLTEVGIKILEAFIAKNIKGVFWNKLNSELI